MTADPSSQTMAPDPDGTVAPGPAKVAVLGAGAWGSTLAKLAADRGCAVALWTRDPQLADLLRVHRTRNRPAGLRLPDKVEVTTQLGVAVADAGLLVVAVSSSGLREVFGRLAPLLRQRREDLPQAGPPALLCASKGLEQGSGLLPTQLYEDILGADLARGFVALGGPSHAEEVGGETPMPTAVVVAGEAWATGLVRAVYHSQNFRVYCLAGEARKDCLAVELGGALKNIIAIATGMAVGRGYGDNTQAAVISRGLREIIRAVRQLYPDLNTDILAGIAGLGDLVGTAMSQHSRNRKFGILMGRGMDAQSAFREVGQVVEGAFAARAMHELAVEHNIHMPLTRLVYEVVHEGKAVEMAALEILGREPRAEDL
jgi:glycerol-3-phosphate dehydrogenase (NAD(P)+)